MKLGERWTRLRTRVTTTAERLRATAFRRLPRLSGLIHHLLQVRVADSATVIAAKTFTTFFPMLFVFAAFAPSPVKDRLKESLQSAIGLHGQSLQEFGTPLTAPGDGSRQAFGYVGMVIIIFSATSFSRSLQKLIERCWYLPKGTTRELLGRWLIFLVGLVLFLIVSGGLRSVIGSRWLAMALTIPLGVGFWWWTQRMLLAGRVNWLPLLPGALLCGVALEVWMLISRMYVPQELNRSVGRYGPLGSVFTILSWLLAIGFILTISLAIGSLVAQWPPFDRWLKTPPERRLRPP